MEDRLDVKIASLKERLKVAETQREARQTKKKARMKKRSRADETRRKILLGAAVSEMMRQNLQLGKKEIESFLKSYLVRPRDFALFFGQENGDENE